MREERKQYPEKVHVWVEIVNHVIGSFFINGNLIEKNVNSILKRLMFGQGL